MLLTVGAVGNHVLKVRSAMEVSALAQCKRSCAITDVPICSLLINTVANAKMPAPADSFVKVVDAQPSAPRVHPHRALVDAWIPTPTAVTAGVVEKRAQPDISAKRVNVLAQVEK